MSNITALNAKPLKCILTNNKRSISLLSDTGSLIVYQPYQDEEYRELYLANKFLAGGYGAKSINEKNNLSYLSNSYLNIFASLDDKDNYLNDLIVNSYNALKRDKIDTVNGISSYTLTSFDDDENRLVYLKDLAKIYTNLPEYKNLEIKSVDYKLSVYWQGSIKTYNNEFNLPKGSKITAIEITIKGNTKNSGGINQISIKPTDENQDSIIITKNNITEKVTFKRDGNFECKIKINYEENKYILIKEGKNKIFDSFVLTVAPTPEDEYLSIYNDGEIINIYDSAGNPIDQNVNIIRGSIKENDIILDNLVINGCNWFGYSFNQEPEVSSNVQITQKILTYKEITADNYLITEGKNIIEIKPRKVNRISIFIPVGYRLLNANYIDLEHNDIINIYNYKTVKKNIYINTDGKIFTTDILDGDERYHFNAYEWIIGSSNNDANVINSNLSIINKSYTSVTNGWSFCKGLLEIDIIKSDSASSIDSFNDDYLSMNWLSDDELSNIYK